MKIVKAIFALVLISQAFCTKASEIFKQPDNHSILSQWFSIDSGFNIKMQMTKMETIEGYNKFQLSFTSDDQHLVNGTLVMPVKQNGKAKLALLLHAMGADENLWWAENKISGNKISEKLIQKGYSVITLDARRHGKRVIDDLTAKDMIAKAHSEEPRLYTDMIIGTVRDYRLALE